MTQSITSNTHLNIHNTFLALLLMRELFWRPSLPGNADPETILQLRDSLSSAGDWANTFDATYDYVCSLSTARVRLLFTRYAPDASATELFENVLLGISRSIWHVRGGEDADRVIFTHLSTVGQLLAL